MFSTHCGKQAPKDDGYAELLSNADDQNAGFAMVVEGDSR